jgi:hypothetical protein
MMQNVEGDMVIPAGYRLTVTSWENDADNYKTGMMEGLFIEKVKFLIEFCKLFESKNQGPGFGNMYDPRDYQKEEFQEALVELGEKHFPHAPYTVDQLLEFAFELQLMSKWIGEGEFYTRVAESVKVEYVPHPIEIQNVTSDFFKD